MPPKRVIQMTPKQIEYARHRAAGIGQAQAAIKAGYAKSSAKVIASRMEKLPAIREAIKAARAEAKGEPAIDADPEFVDAESYLLAVVQGLAPPDPVRVGAARALLPYLNARTRAPVKSATPKQMQAHATNAEDKDMLDAWAAKAAKVRARLKRTA